MQAQNWGKPTRKPVWLSHVPAPFRFSGESGWAGGGEGVRFSRESLVLTWNSFLMLL